ncbi:M48 family metallopeptidase [Tepidibacter mesophilus]|uniref:M48 family metallopeptidase n=1 Tax=Tepidibacter mesophilus TaxID=655607 RepID=UPI000C0683EF|nr:M48 family metallopeptidase [Tepidibacter mesophilus]
MSEYVNSKENIYFIISLIFSLICYALFIVCSIGIGLVYLLTGLILSFLLHGLLIGNLKGNAVKISNKQFPEVYGYIKDFSNTLNLQQVPDVYIIQSGGILNAFATKFLGRNFVVIYSDVLEMAYEKGEDAVKFIICHELTHIKRNHMTKNALILGSAFIPFLHTAYSRACEYTCDSFATKLIPTGAIDGLLALTCGKKLYTKINITEYCNQISYEAGFFTWLYEVNSTHPNLTKRVKNVIDLGAIQNHDNTNEKSKELIC